MSAATLIAGSLLGLGACATFTSSWRHLRDRLPILTLVWLSVVAVELRWAYLRTELMAPLWPDAESVHRLSLAMTHPYDTGVREPLWLWVAWVFQKLFGPGPTAMRLLSLVASVLIVPAAYLLGRDYGRSKLVGLIAAGFITVHAYQARRGIGPSC